MIETNMDENYYCSACDNKGSRIYQLSTGEWEVEECECLEILDYFLHCLNESSEED